MTVTRRAFELHNSQGDPIRGDVYHGAGSESGKAIVVCHGFKGFKDWGFFPYLGEQLHTKTGYPVMTFNFSGNGVGPDLLNFSELDKFERNTFSKELDDLQVVLDSAEQGALPDIDPCRQFGLLGHSRGGLSAIVTASEDPRVRCLVTWAAIASLDRWPEERKAEWRRTGKIEILNTRTGQLLPLGVGLLEDAEQNAERLDPLRAAKRLQVPYLIVHGAEDESVSIVDAEWLLDAGPADSTRLERIEAAGHTFGAVHPFKGTTEHLSRAIDASAAWLADHL